MRLALESCAVRAFGTHLNRFYGLMSMAFFMVFPAYKYRIFKYTLDINEILQLAVGHEKCTFNTLCNPA